MDWLIKFHGWYLQEPFSVAVAKFSDSRTKSYGFNPYFELAIIQPTVDSLIWIFMYAKSIEVC